MVSEIDMLQAKNLKLEASCETNRYKITTLEDNVVDLQKEIDQADKRENQLT